MTERPTYIPQRFQFFWRALSLVITVGTALVAVTVAMNSEDIGSRETEFVVLGVFAMLAIATGILSRNLHGWTGDFLQGVSTEMIGAILSGFIILIVVGAAQDRELRDSLVRDAGSPAHTTAIDAVYELRERDLLLGENGLLDGVSLDRADLHRADLTGANLAATTLNSAVLNETIFTEADLESADLTGADISEANFVLANLQGAELDRTNAFQGNFTRALAMNANFESADLTAANLQRADFTGADLNGVSLTAASLRETIMVGANLEEASFINANLISADFRNANLVRADFGGANLKDASFEGAVLAGFNANGRAIYAEFDEDTILPNGKFYNPDYIGNNPVEQLAEFGAIVTPQTGY